MRLQELTLAMLLVASSATYATEDDDVLIEDEPAVEIKIESAAPPFRDSHGDVRFESQVFGTRLCGIVDEPQVGDAFDQGATYVTVCDAD